jgi:transposase
MRAGDRVQGEVTMQREQTKVEFWFGIDGSKKKLDVAYADQKGKYRVASFDNSATGFEKLLNWCLKLADERQPVFCMEATGDYHIGIAMFLTERACHVSVINPAWIKHFGLGKGRINKSDSADAKLICEYGINERPKAWDLANPLKGKLFRLSRRRGQLQGTITAELNRRECPEAIGPECMESIKRTLKVLRAELREVEAVIGKLIETDKELILKFEILRSLGPIGLSTFLAVFAELPDVEDCADARGFAESAGGNSISKQSGTSLNVSGFNRGGRRHARSALWMVALMLLRKIPELDALYNRLRARGKSHKSALLACLHKLLMIIYGMLKHNKPYNTRDDIIKVPKSEAILTKA